MSDPRRATASDVAVVGAGIVGLAAAYQLSRARPEISLTVLEKEPGPARHQSGHNSGVVHSGLYYRPGSNKATMVRSGREMLFEYCDERGLPYEVCGKIVVATRESEIPALAALADRGRANGLEVEVLAPDQVRAHEPHIASLGGLHVPATGIVDFCTVAETLSRDLVASGHELRFGTPVSAITVGDSQVTLAGPWGSTTARMMVNCGGLHSDRLARLAGSDTGGVRIMPFRGEYYDLAPEAAGMIHNLVYPVPDPSFPFLGVHFTRTIGGEVHVGPNAVPALRREGYTWADFSARDLAEVITSPSTWKLARRHWRTGAGEVTRSLVRRAFWQEARRMLPDLLPEDLHPGGAGVRAQAIARDGMLVDDFVISTSPRAVHVVNAPSPAATASLAIGSSIADLVISRLS